MNVCEHDVCISKQTEIILVIQVLFHKPKGFPVPLLPNSLPDCSKLMKSIQTLAYTLLTLPASNWPKIKEYHKLLLQSIVKIHLYVCNKHLDRKMEPNQWQIIPLQKQRNHKVTGDTILHLSFFFLLVHIIKSGGLTEIH